MAELKGQDGEVRFTLEVKRAATGKVETFEMIGKVASNGGNALNGGEKRRD